MIVVLMQNKNIIYKMYAHKPHTSICTITIIVVVLDTFFLKLASIQVVYRRK
jgi:hypothetical protein